METLKKYNFTGVMATSDNISYLTDYLNRNELSSAGVIGWNSQTIDMVLSSDTLTPYDPLTNPCEFTFVIFKYPEKAKCYEFKSSGKDINERNYCLTNEKYNELKSEELDSNLNQEKLQETNNCLSMKLPLNDFYLRPQIRNCVKETIKCNEKVPIKMNFQRNKCLNNSLKTEHYMNNIPYWFKKLKNDHCDETCFKVVEEQKPCFKHLNLFNLNDKHCLCLSKNSNKMETNNLPNSNSDNNCPLLSEFNIKILCDEKLRPIPKIYDEIVSKS
ncbi:hypothetical protein DMUE_0801 [Dictyocoela muelleri]|nr:hypothetical protein DMUE_0801 [Dictyocoela muelleri]